MAALFLQPGQVAGQNGVPNIIGMIQAGQPGNPYPAVMPNNIQPAAQTVYPTAQQPIQQQASIALPEQPQTPQSSSTKTSTMYNYGGGYDMSLLGAGQAYGGGQGQPGIYND